MCVEMSGLKPGEVAYRITSGKHQGRLCWTNDYAIEGARKARRNVEVQLVTENVAYYGLWGGEKVKVSPKHLTKVHTVVVWSDELDALRST